MPMEARIRQYAAAVDTNQGFPNWEPGQIRPISSSYRKVRQCQDPCHKDTAQHDICCVFATPRATLRTSSSISY
jgi:hypothetical protein